MAKRTLKSKIKERRRKRKERRAARKEQFALIVKTAKSLDLSGVELTGRPKKDNVQDIFNKIWPVMKEVLIFLILLRITGKKADKNLQKLIQLGEQLVTASFSNNLWKKFSELFAKSWSIIRNVLEFVMLFVEDKLLETLGKIIEIGDWIAEDVN